MTAAIATSFAANARRDTAAPGRRLDVALLAGLTAVVALFGAIDVAADLGTDFGAYFSHGWFMTRGLAPYADFWTHKTPLLPMILAVWIDAFGTGFVAAVAFPLAVTAAASYCAYLFAVALDLPRRTGVVAALMFAGIGASHVIDPTRNGVIVIAAAAFEMLAFVLALGATSGRRATLAGAGLLLALAVATRQTAAVASVPLALTLWARRARIGDAVRDVALVALGGIAGIAAFLAYFLVASVPLATVWDQVYRFNLTYAAGYHMKLTWWVGEWLRIGILRGLLAATAGVLACAWIGRSRLDLPPRHVVLVLGSLAAAHALAIHAAQKVQAMYLFQMLPELSVAAGILLAPALEIRRAGRRAAAAIVMFAALVQPLAVEARHWTRTVRAAASGGYLLAPRNLPSQVTARTVQGLVPRADDRIWVFSASSDPLYPFANRLPAVARSSTASLAYAMTDAQVEQWQREFAAAKPALVVSFYGDDYVRRARNARPSGGGRSVLAIREYIVGHMRQVSAPGVLPELFAW